MKTKQTKSRRRILHPDRSDNYYLVPQSSVGQKQGQFSLGFYLYLPSHIPLFVPFFLARPGVVEVCNFHETQQIMQYTACEVRQAASILLVTRQPAITTGKMKQKKMPGSLLYVLFYHNSMLSFLHIFSHSDS